MNGNPESVAAGVLAGAKVLLADDEERLRVVVGMMLEELGAQVVSVASCELAVELYCAPQADFDLVLLDLRMKGMGGVGAFRELTARAPGAKVILASGIRPEESLLRELAEKGGAFLEKPFDLDQLGNLARTMLTSR